MIRAKPPSGAPVRRPRKPLDRRAIVEKALALIDRDGLEELSMRRLGAALGVEGMAIYHHFRNKGELLDGVLELLLEEMEPPPAGSLPPLERIRATFESCRAVAIRHPHAFWLLPARRFRTDRQLEYYERLLRIFEEAGFDPALSARFFRLLAGYVTGVGLAEIGSRALQPDATPIRLERFRDTRRFPRVSAVVPHLRVKNLEAIFKFGMDLIFGAMRRQSRRPRTRRRTPGVGVS